MKIEQAVIGDALLEAAPVAERLAVIGAADRDAAIWRAPGGGRRGSSLNAASSGMPVSVTSQSALAAVGWEMQRGGKQRGGADSFQPFDPSRLNEDNCRARSLSAICRMVIVCSPPRLLHFGPLFLTLRVVML